MRRRLAAILALAGLLAAACSKKEAPSAASKGLEEAPAPSQPAASAASDNAAPPPPAEPAATATAAPTTVPSPTPLATAHAPPPAPKPALHPSTPESTPSPDHGQKKVAVHANSRYACTGGEKREGVLASPEPHGARITITGQGPCPGEVRDWAAEVSASRIDVNATHGTQARCRCSGTGDLVLRGLDPGTYDVHVNGGFDRPIATRVVVLQ
jgi:hypothetical protein